MDLRKCENRRREPYCLFAKTEVALLSTNSSMPQMVTVGTVWSPGTHAAGRVAEEGWLFVRSARAACVPPARTATEPEALPVDDAEGIGVVAAAKVDGKI